MKEKEPKEKAEAEKKEQELKKQKEAEQLLKHLDERDMVLLLDENGKTFTSRQFAAYLQKCMNAGPKRVVQVLDAALHIPGL